MENMTNDQLYQRVRYTFSMFEEGDVDKISANLHPDIKYTEFGLENTYNLNKQQFETFLRTMFASIKDLKHEIRSVNRTADGSHIVIEWSLSFKYLKDVPEHFPGKKATGQEVVAYGISYQKNEGEKAVEITRYAQYFFDGNAPSMK